MGITAAANAENIAIHVKTISDARRAKLARTSLEAVPTITFVMLAPKDIIVLGAQ